jgi:hypothetical protein
MNHLCSMKIQHADDLLSKVNLEMTPGTRTVILDELSYLINQLLVHDFSLLVHLLYKADINEKKLKELLSDNKQTDAALIISELLLQRQEEKLRSRKMFRSSDDFDEAEKW